MTVGDFWFVAEVVRLVRLANSLEISRVQLQETLELLNDDGLSPVRRRSGQVRMIATADEADLRCKHLFEADQVVDG